MTNSAIYGGGKTIRIWALTHEQGIRRAKAQWLLIEK